MLTSDEDVCDLFQLLAYIMLLYSLMRGLLDFVCVLYRVDFLIEDKLELNSIIFSLGWLITDIKVGESFISGFNTWIPMFLYLFLKRILLPV